jgi:hypothetical protein
MNPEEIRAEIERRKKVARDLKLSQKVWSLYNSNFQYIDDRLKKDPELIFPEIRQSLVRSGDSYEFKFKESTYHLQCKKSKDERDRYGSNDSATTPMTFALKVDGNLVYEFDMRRTVVYGPDSPDFSESFGNISAFIEGPWTADIDELQALCVAILNRSTSSATAPKVAAQLQQDMKKFGLRTIRQIGRRDTCAAPASASGTSFLGADNRSTKVTKPSGS